jgi:hypothetical protein
MAEKSQISIQEVETLLSDHEGQQISFDTIDFDNDNVVFRKTDKEGNTSTDTVKMNKLNAVVGAQVQFNSPDEPLQLPVLSANDRLNLDMGNVRGNVLFLKNKFQDAKVNSHDNIVFLKNGAWVQADPNWLGEGDAWSKAEEMLKEFPDLAREAGTIAFQGVGAMLGGMMGNIPGAIAGAGIGGVIGNKVVNSFGRLAGTYDATQEEELQDNLLEGVLSLGFQSFAGGYLAVS